jgi:hypothetical protein
LAERAKIVSGKPPSLTALIVVDVHSAEEVHAMTLANLNGEFARIVLAAEAIAGLDDSSE